VVVDLLVPPGTPPTPPPDAFLQGLYTFTAVNLTENGAPASPNALAQAVDAATNSYYAHVDPTIGGVSSRDTLAKFITHNQFSSEIHAIYTNTIDLGFGRDMHCTSNLASDNETDYACYVINHGSYATDDHADFEAAVTDAVPPGTVKAAVAMEYARIEDPNSPGSFEPVGRVMKFFVYLFDNGGNTTRINAANLDGLGDRPVPQLCMVCHAGSLPSPGAGAPPGSAPGFATAADVNLGSVFLPFDLSGFTFEDGFNPTFNRLAQEPAFKSLNQNIVFNATSPAIKEIITKMYAGNPPEQNALFVVDGWNNQLGNAGAPDPAVQRFYKNVIGTSCRGCHAAQPPTGVNSRKIEFNNAADFIPLGSQVDSYVCSQHVMPHALATYNRFWTNLYPLGSLLSLAPAELKIFGDAYMPNASHTQFNGCGLNVTTTQQPGLPVYNTVGTTPGIDQIFDNHCGFSGCHNGSGAGLPGVMHLGTGQFGQIVDVTSIQAPPMKRVKSTGTRVDSYLWHKIDGSQVAAGGSGSRMPLGPPLNPGDPERTLIEAWLDAGAPLQ
jgi:cytochrome c5